jgi:hypothetical protein
MGKESLAIRSTLCSDTRYDLELSIPNLRNNDLLSKNNQRQMRIQLASS